MPIHQIHPIVVHFPIALLLVGFLLDGLFLILARRAWADVTFILVVLGIAGAFAAGFTGEVAEHAIEPLAEPTKAALKAHHEFAGLVNFFGTGMLALRLLVRLRPAKRLFLAAYLAIGLGTCALLGVTARRGGVLVYDHGAGTNTGHPLPQASDSI
ncbi:MAG TPA: DUF2231 domain-containing protein [bacterium]|jgi:uncharacterized membrane protein